MGFIPSGTKMTSFNLNSASQGSVCCGKASCTQAGAEPRCSWLSTGMLREVGARVGVPCCDSDSATATLEEDKGLLLVVQPQYGTAWPPSKFFIWTWADPSAILGLISLKDAQHSKTREDSWGPWFPYKHQTQGSPTCSWSVPALQSLSTVSYVTPQG